MRLDESNSKKKIDKKSKDFKKNFFAFNSFYYVRRFLLGITIIYSDKQLIWQLFSMVFQFTVMLILLGNEPLKSKGNNRFELFNECMIMIIMY